MNLRHPFTLLAVLGALGAAGCSGDEDSNASGGAGGGAGSTGSGMAASGGSSGSGAAGGSAGASGNGGSDGISGAPDIDPSTQTDDLTVEQKAELCDWTQTLRGGYGVTVDCGHQVLSRTFDSQEECVAVGFLHSGCDPTVAMWSACQIAQVPDGGCITPPECVAISEC